MNPQRFHVLIVVLLLHGPVHSAEEIGPMWPSTPVKVSPIEGVIEAFWNPGLRATSRWKSVNGTLARSWDACFFKMQVEATGETASVSRAYRIALGDYQQLRIRLRPGKEVKTSIVAEVDGKEQTVAEVVSTTNDAFEIAGPIHGNQLTKLTMTFTIQPDASVLLPENEPGIATKAHAIQLRWVMLERDGISWEPPQEPFKGLIVKGPVGRFEPGLGLLFGPTDVQQTRDVVNSKVFADLWKADLEYAKRQYLVDPASLIRPYSLYAPTRYGRDTDLNYKTIHNGISLALVGLLTRNEDYLRQAARHAVTLARIGQWSEGFVDTMPDYRWYHSGFAPNIATIKASLLLDWTWHYLTPEGRQLIRNAIAKKGLPFVERAKDAMANQGIRFNKGMILGKMALADSLDEPELRNYVQACIDRINGKLEKVVRPDGTFSEGIGYGKGTMACTPISYHAASRCLDVPIAELVTPRMLPSMRYVIQAEGKMNPALAAFCAGPLGDATFESQCVPTGLLHNFFEGNFPTSKYEGNRIEYLFFGLVPLWAPKIQQTPKPPALDTFSAYQAGGWVFAGNKDPAEPRLSFESGLWDGHGHSWFHKNAVTLDGWGERLLISRHYLSYSDARSQYTMQTKLYNTFAPTGRNQDASGTLGRGGELLVAEDLGPMVVVESDNATAWHSGVKRAIRRVLFIRPNVLIIQDDAEFTKSECGVQSWNSFNEWKRIDDRTHESRVGQATVRLTSVLPQQLSFTTGQDSVSREESQKGPTEFPVYRAAFTTDSTLSHNVLTIIEAIGLEKADYPDIHIRETDHRIEVQSANQVIQVMPARDSSSAGPIAGYSSNGRLLIVAREGDKVTQAVALGATWLQTPGGRVDGKGCLRWPDDLQKPGESQGTTQLLR